MVVLKKVKIHNYELYICTVVSELYSSMKAESNQAFCVYQRRTCYIFSVDYLTAHDRVFLLIIKFVLFFVSVECVLLCPSSKHSPVEHLFMH